MKVRQRRLIFSLFVRQPPQLEQRQAADGDQAVRETKEEAAARAREPEFHGEGRERLCFRRPASAAAASPTATKAHSDGSGMGMMTTGFKP